MTNPLRPELHRPSARIVTLGLCIAAVISGCTAPPRRATSERVSAAPMEAARQCRANLQEMQRIKQQWAAEEHKSANDRITREDLMRIDRYILNRFECPEGGTYDWGRVGEAPTCSIAGHIQK